MEDKLGDERTRDWLKQKRFQRRVETAKIRRSNKYLKGQIKKAAKTFELDNTYEIFSGEISVQHGPSFGVLVFNSDLQNIRL